MQKRLLHQIRSWASPCVGIALLALALAACGSSSTASQATQATAVPDLARSTSTAVPPQASPTPTPTAAPVATPSPAPEAVATATPQSSSQASTYAASAALAPRLAAEAMDFLTAFASPRASGTDEERAAAEFLAARLKAMGYETHLQPFTVDMPSSRVQMGPEAQEVRSFPLAQSASGTVTGLLADVGGAFEGEVPSQGLDGKIALVKRGKTTFEEKVGRVADAGAVAAVIYNNVDGLFRGAMLTPGRIPAVSISSESGQAILDLMAGGEIEVTVSVALELRNSQNVIAEKQGTADDGTAVVLGGHYDTVPNVPGANDNGSGIATLVTIARKLADKSYPFTVRFIGFGSEELGLLGSRFYVDSLGSEERDSTVLMLNFDALAADGTFAVLGEFDLTAKAVEYGREIGIDIERRFTLSGGSSDHASFQDAGIPVVVFFDDDFSRIHTSDDRLALVPAQQMGDAAVLALFLVDSLAAP